MHCPILQHLPINQILPRVKLNPYTRNYQKTLKDIVKNSDFNNNEFLKHIKLDNAISLHAWQTKLYTSLLVTLLLKKHCSDHLQYSRIVYKDYTLCR